MCSHRKMRCCSGASVAPDQRTRRNGRTSLCDRRLAGYRLSYLEALEFGMLQIEWPCRIIPGARMRGAELLRFGPPLEGGFALPHRMRGIKRVVFALGSFEQMEL